MKYFIDTEFLEGPQDKKLFGVKYGQTKPTIDLISIGIVSEDTPAFSNRIGKTDRVLPGREYYAVSKDFNLKQAWKEEWIRMNVLHPIFRELAATDPTLPFHGADFKYGHLKYLINKFGKTNKHIAEEIKDFCGHWNSDGSVTFRSNQPVVIPTKPEFYAYYADYDWVVFCQLFGRMIDLPKGFPMYCKDIKQLMDECAVKKRIHAETGREYFPQSVEEGLKKLKSHPGYPKQENEHNALADTKFNKKLYEFLTDNRWL